MLAFREHCVVTSGAARRWTLPREMGARRCGHVPKQVEIVCGRPILQKVHKPELCAACTALLLDGFLARTRSCTSTSLVDCIALALCGPALCCSRLHEPDESIRNLPKFAAPARPQSYIAQGLARAEAGTRSPIATVPKADPWELSRGQHAATALPCQSFWPRSCALVLNAMLLRAGEGGVAAEGQGF